MRDIETAQIGIQSSLTGHLVLSTVHTNSAVAAIARLRDMGIESYLLASSLKTIIAQRLVRRLCNNCKTVDSPDDETLKNLNLEIFLKRIQNLRLFLTHEVMYLRGVTFQRRKNNESSGLRQNQHRLAERNLR